MLINFVAEEIGVSYRLVPTNFAIEGNGVSCSLVPTKIYYK